MGFGAYLASAIYLEPRIHVNSLWLKALFLAPNLAISGPVSRGCHAAPHCEVQIKGSRSY